MARPGSRDRSWCPLRKATIGVTDWAVTHSDVTYDVVPVWQGAFFRLERLSGPVLRHRLRPSCRMDVSASTGPMASPIALHDDGWSNPGCAMPIVRWWPRAARRSSPEAATPANAAIISTAWCVPYIHVIKPDIAGQGRDRSGWREDTHVASRPDSVNPLRQELSLGRFHGRTFRSQGCGDLRRCILSDHAW